MKKPSYSILMTVIIVALIVVVTVLLILRVSVPQELLACLVAAVGGFFGYAQKIPDPPKEPIALIESKKEIVPSDSEPPVI